MSIEQILKNTNYHLDLFSDSEIAALESCITTRQSNGNTLFYARCLKESERLLDAAKRAVEIAIEQNEAAALKRLEH